METIIIIGAGVSGLSAAINAKKENNKVIILEKNDKPLKKLLLTGNGKCNYYNDEWNITKYSSKNKEKLSHLINEENKQKIENFYSKIGLIPRIKNGYYYPASLQAYTLYNVLLKEAKLKNVEIKYNFEVKKIEEKNSKYLINDSLLADKLVISSGSLSYPKTGSDGFSYSFARSLGIKVEDTFPALVPLNIDNKTIKNLSGVRSEVEVSLYKNGSLIDLEKGEIQFTDTGLSGICIYNLTVHIDNENYKIRINFLSDFNITKDNFEETLNNRNLAIKNRTITEHLEYYLNYKIVNEVLRISKINPDKKINDLTLEEKNTLKNNLLSLEFNIEGRKDYNYSQATLGGISLDEINTKTLEVNTHKNLYFTGESLDVVGKCGGYNISFAMLSGILLGEHIND